LPGVLHWVNLGGHGAGLVKHVVFDLLHGDADSLDVFGRAIVSQVCHEPFAGSGGIYGAHELGEALGPWVALAQYVAYCSIGDACSLFKLAGGDVWLLAVFAKGDG
jgi:hypothetical protein